MSHTIDKFFGHHRLKTLGERSLLSLSDPFPFKHLLIWSYLSLFIFITAPRAQLTGYWEDFNDGVLSGWEMPNPATFSLSESNGTLRVEYRRSASSWEWDNFNFKPPQLINVVTHPAICIKAKANISTQLTVKPIYEDGRHDWLQANLVADEQWHTFAFSLTTSGSTLLNRIYFYLDGGSNAVKSGLVFFDDLQMGEMVISPKKAELQAAITVAKALWAHSEEGEQFGQFPPGSRHSLLAAIALAESLYASPALSDVQIEAACWDLYDACVRFESRNNLPNPGLNDRLATLKTKYLYYHLHRLTGQGVIFGMHDATGYGVGWSGDDDRSDVKDVCGDYPGLYSWDMNHVDRNDADDLSHFVYRIRAAHARGGVNTLCWHQTDPKYGYFYSDQIASRGWYNVVRSLLPNGQYHSFYRARLRAIAKFLKSLRGEDGHAIPIIFRPFHEHLGAWFWWGAGRCSSDEYNRLWRFTQIFLRDSLNVHNLIYAISPSDFSDRADYLRIYPGDDMVDIFGMDFYFTNSSSAGQFAQRIRIPAQLGLERGKVAAVTEVGEENLPTANWFTGYLLPPLKSDTLTKRLVYAAVWRNAHLNHFFAPWPSHASVPDFIKFYLDPYTLFENDLPDMFGPEQADTEPPRFLVHPAEQDTVTYTHFSIHIVTNERAVLRFSDQDQAYEAMPFAFTQGQGDYEHHVSLLGEQGQSYTYYIRASDLAGNISPSLHCTFYVDTLQRVIRWHDLLYQSDDWPCAPAPLGYRDKAVVTTIDTARTVYFRKLFSLSHIPKALGFLIKCHDGAVAYLNGVEIGRANMPMGIDISFETPAASTTPSSKIFVFNQALLNQLRLGSNLLAVEVHTAATATADLCFDGRLFNQDSFFIDLGEPWHFNDRGRCPPSQRLGELLAGIANPKESVPGQFGLEQNYPNPFNATTQIEYHLSHPGHIQIELFDITGRWVRTLFAGEQTAGPHRLTLTADKLASAVYFIRLQCGSDFAVRKMALVR